MEHKCADEAAVQMERLTEIRKRIKKAKAKREIIRGKMGYLSQELDRLSDKIEED